LQLDGEVCLLVDIAPVRVRQWREPLQRGIAQQLLDDVDRERVVVGEGRGVQDGRAAHGLPVGEAVQQPRLAAGHRPLHEGDLTAPGAGGLAQALEEVEHLRSQGNLRRQLSVWLGLPARRHVLGARVRPCHWSSGQTCDGKLRTVPVGNSPLIEIISQTPSWRLLRIRLLPRPGVAEEG
jgi:hypothetical protein